VAGSADSGNRAAMVKGGESLLPSNPHKMKNAHPVFSLFCGEECEPFHQVSPFHRTGRSPPRRSWRSSGCSTGSSGAKGLPAAHSSEEAASRPRDRHAPAATRDRTLHRSHPSPADSEWVTLTTLHAAPPAGLATIRWGDVPAGVPILSDVPIAAGACSTFRPNASQRRAWKRNQVSYRFSTAARRETDAEPLATGAVGSSNSRPKPPWYLHA
jgi:hypothetical protein